MTRWERFKEWLSNGGQGFTRSWRVSREKMRIRGQLKENENMIDKLTYQVGLSCVRGSTEDTSAELEEYCVEIARLRKLNREYQRQLEQMAATKACPQCGFNNHVDTRFCVSCGAKMPESLTRGKKCSECGVMNIEEAEYCVACGQKFETEIAGRITEMPEETAAGEAILQAARAVHTEESEPVEDFEEIPTEDVSEADASEGDGASVLEDAEATAAAETAKEIYHEVV